MADRPTRPNRRRRRSGSGTAQAVGHHRRCPSGARGLGGGSTSGGRPAVSGSAGELLLQTFTFPPARDAPPVWLLLRHIEGRAPGEGGQRGGLSAAKASSWPASLRGQPPTATPVRPDPTHATAWSEARTDGRTPTDSERRRPRFWTKGEGRVCDVLFFLEAAAAYPSRAGAATRRGIVTQNSCSRRGHHGEEAWGCECWTGGEGATHQALLMHQ